MHLAYIATKKRGEHASSKPIFQSSVRLAESNRFANHYAEAAEILGCVVMPDFRNVATYQSSAS
jgi:hypothetical protein